MFIEKLPVTCRQVTGSNIYQRLDIDWISRVLCVCFGIETGKVHVKKSNNDVLREKIVRLKKDQGGLGMRGNGSVHRPLDA